VFECISVLPPTDPVCPLNYVNQMSSFAQQYGNLYTKATKAFREGDTDLNFEKMV
jgi:hypothetical protein